jgi:hypothetical protein
MFLTVQLRTFSLPLSYAKNVDINIYNIALYVVSYGRVILSLTFKKHTVKVLRRISGPEGKLSDSRMEIIT